MQLSATLSPDEQSRAARFHFPEHRARYIVARGALRSILAGYLHVAPASVAFIYDALGKPALRPSCNRADIRFNLTHSGELALCACASRREIGIDVEQLRKLDNADDLAERYFDAVELSTYQALARDGRLNGFFVRWTLKEAYIKALGRGLSVPLGEFTVRSTPDASGRHPVEHAAESARWSAARLNTWPGYVAALVAEGHDWHITYRDWMPSG